MRMKQQLREIDSNKWSVLWGGVLVAAFGTATDAHSQPVDTSAWVCEFCPFETNYRADYEIGASSVSDDSAYFGDASGYDEDGVYANVGGEGSYSSDSQQFRWSAENLGLDSRYIEFSGGRQSRYDYDLAYREIPRRRFITTETIFVESGAGTLALPSGWERAATIANFSSLNSNLVRRDIESDRNVLELGGRYRPRDDMSVSVHYRRQDHEGVKIAGASFFTNSSILPMPFDYITDEVDFDLRYTLVNGFVSLGWYLSDFDSDNVAVGWENPFLSPSGLTPMATETFSLAQAPDNRLQQLSLRAGYSFPTYDTVISISAATGEITQDTGFLPYTTNSSVVSDSLPRSNLDGEVDTSNYSLILSSGIIDKLRFKLNFRYDERDNKSARDLWNRVIVDSFVSGDLELNVPYSFERSNLSVRGDYALFDTVRVSAGYDRKEIDRDFQEVAEQTEDSGWGRARWRPSSSIEVDVRAGTSKRDIDRYNEALAITIGQNPLLRKYNLAYRYREFGEMSVSYSPASIPVSVSLNSFFTDDSYSRSVLGLIRGKELAIDADLSWTFSQKSSAYLTAGIENRESEQAGSDQFATPDWFAAYDDEFSTVGAGFRVREIADKMDLQLDYLRSVGSSEITIDAATAPLDNFPELTTEMDLLKLRLTYRRNERIDVNLNLQYQQFTADDWALSGVDPATIPVVLGLGENPYDDDAFMVGIGIRYRLGPSVKTAAE